MAHQRELEEQQRKDEVMKDVSDFPEVKQQHEDIPIYSHHAATDEEKVRLNVKRQFDIDHQDKRTYACVCVKFYEKDKINTFLMMTIRIIVRS